MTILDLGFEIDLTGSDLGFSTILINFTFVTCFLILMFWMLENKNDEGL